MSTVVGIVLLLVLWIVYVIFCFEGVYVCAGTEADTRIRGRGKIISDLMVLSDVNGLLKIVPFSGVVCGELLSILGYRYPAYCMILGILLCVFGSKILRCN